MAKKFKDLAAPPYADPDRRARIAEARAQAEADIVAQRLSEVRRNRGLDQAEIADRLGISQSGMSRLENSGDPKVSTFHRMAEALGGRLHIGVSIDGEMIELTQPTEGAT